jgi:hypothetical protein
MNIEAVRTWDPSFPIFTGDYYDFDPQWYAYVGSTIILYMILNTVTAHLSLLFSFITKGIKKCTDRCCGKITRKRTRQEFLGLYTGPKFCMGIRYSQMLTTIIIIMVYSSGMPSLYLLSFVFFLISYWIDKILILRYYRSPPHINLYMSKLFTFLIFLGIIIHLCFGIWIYGNKYILPYNDKTFLDSISTIMGQYLSQYAANSPFKQEVVRKLSLPHNIIMLILLGSIVCFYIVKKLIFDPLRFICRYCRSAKLDMPDTALNIYEGKVLLK